MDFDYIPKEELYFKDEETALKVSELLLNAGYVVMLSKEEGAIILNYIHTYDRPEADRNGVIFVSREDYEWAMYEHSKEVYADLLENDPIKRGVEVMGDTCEKEKTENVVTVIEEKFWRE